MSKARTLANLISDNAELADGQISVAEVVGAAPTANPTFTGTVNADAITMSGFLTVNGGADFNTVLYPDGIAMADSRTISFGTSANFELNGGSTFLDFNLKDNARHLRIKNNLVEHHRFSGDGSVIFNTSGADADFRVESDSNEHMLFVDGGNDRVGIGTTPSAQLHIANNSSCDVRVQGGSNSRAQIQYKNDAQQWNVGINGSDNYVIYDSTNSFEAMTIGATTGRTVTFNENSVDLDFRVESDNNANAFVVDAGTSIVRIGAGSDLANNSQRKLSVTTPWKESSSIAYDGTLSLVATGGGSSGGRGSNIIFTGEDGASTRTFAKIDSFKENSTSGDHDGALVFRTRKNGSGLPARLHLLSYAAIFNDDSDDTDFIVESNSNSNAFVVNAGDNTVTMFKGALSDSTVGHDFRSNGQTTIVCNNTVRNLNLNNISGSTHSAIGFQYSTVVKGSVTVSSTGTTYNTTSDRRLKDNIQPIADATDKLMAMNPVTHTWKADPDAPAVHGFIAQEMQEIVPEAVSGDPDGEEMMSMDYGRITPVLVTALQDAVSEIKALKERVAELEGK